MAARFVADVGGTNIRLAQEVNGQVSNIKKYLCADYATIDDAIKTYFAEFSDLQFESGCIAIACPVQGDAIRMTNHHWQFSISALEESLGLQWLAVINDFKSVAHSVPALGEGQKIQVGPGKAVADENIAVFGPGTGLGVAHLTMTEQGWKALPGEGGHVSFAPVDEYDFAIWHFLNDKFGYVDTEEVISGRGIGHIYQALAAHLGKPAELTDPADITAKALDKSCELCEQTLAQFCRVLGSFAGNLALTMATTGGVFVGGGIAPRFVDYLQESDFRARFEAKGRFKAYVETIPTYVITEPDHGLLGAAAYLEQHFKG